MDELFSDAAYQSQPGVANNDLEKLVLHEFEDIMAGHLIYKAYKPPHQPFQPFTPWPGYLRM